MVPLDKSTRRIRWFPTSQIRSRPSAIDGNAVRLTQLRPRGRAAVPENPGTPVPATVEIDARVRIDFPHDVVVALGDVQVPGGVELNLVRHVQRSAVAGPPSPLYAF